MTSLSLKAAAIASLLGLVVPGLRRDILCQSSWDRYIPRSFAQADSAIRPVLLREYKDRPGPVASLSNGEYASKTRVRFLDSTRVLSRENRGMIEMWVRVRGVDPNALSAFQHEVLFAEDSIRLWLPVQEVLLPALRAEVRPGEFVTLFNIYVGGYGDSAKVTLVFLVNEFSRK